MRILFSLVLITLAATTADAGPRARRMQSCSGESCGASAYAAPATCTGPNCVVSEATIPIALATTEGADALDQLNAQRARRGLRPYLRDEGLMQAARSAASYRAQRRIFGHTGNDFAFLPAGTSATAAGCAGNEPSWGFMSCCAYENWTYAGAAAVLGSDGKLYCHLFVR